MKLSEAIQQLQSLLVEHGDIELKSETVDENGKICYAEPIFVQQGLTVISSEKESSKTTKKQYSLDIDSIADYVQEHYTP